MELKLTITGSATALARILASLGAGDTLTVEAAPAPALATAAPTPAPAPMPTFAPTPLASPAEALAGLPVVAAPMPAVTPAPMPESVSAVLDVRGVPHDERVHAANKATNGDGSWRKKKGVDAAVVAAIEAELLGRPAPTVSMTPLNPSPMPAVAMPAPPMPAPVTPPMPVPAPEPEPVATPAPAPAPTGPIDFPALMAHIGPKMSQMHTDGQPVINPAYLQTLVQRINEAFAPHGKSINAITDVGADQQLLDFTVQLIQFDGRW